MDTLADDDGLDTVPGGHWSGEFRGTRSPADVNANDGQPVDLARLLIDTVRDYAIFALDPNGCVLSWNAGAQRIKGYLAAEIIGRHFSTFYPPESIASRLPERELEIAIREGRVEDEGWRLRKDGTRFWASVVITALHFDDGALAGFAKVTRDLTERRMAQERAVEDARRLAEAEAANRTKSEFLAAMSHELRTPLNAIGGYAELLELGVAGSVSPLQQEYLGRIRTSQRHLLAIITDLLNYSRIEAGQVTYDMGRVPLAAAVDTVFAMIEPQAAEKQLSLRHESSAAGQMAWADRHKVEQIVLNLLSNAVKFTPRGGEVVVTTESVDDEQVAVVVRDTGPGIPADKRTVIFEPFVQVGRSLTSMHEGTGLGLAISRDMAQAMGGNVELAERESPGAEFRLVLKRAEGD